MNSPILILLSFLFFSLREKGREKKDMKRSDLFNSVFLGLSKLGKKWPNSILSLSHYFDAKMIKIGLNAILKNCMVKRSCTMKVFRQDVLMCVVFQSTKIINRTFLYCFPYMQLSLFPLSDNKKNPLNLFASWLLSCIALQLSLFLTLKSEK